MSASPPPRTGFFAKGGWFVVAALGVATVAFAFHAATLVRHRARPVGDGRRVETYGFAMDPCTVPRDLIVASGLPKGGLPALVEPAVWTPAQADAATTRYTKFLVPSDRVIGVSLGGNARAYPLRVLVWHEVVNDTLAGEPILVTYSPLCDSAAAFRRPGTGAPDVFGVSGLLYDSTLRMYDRRTSSQAESLWNQLLARAICGPAAARGSTLTVMPISVETWGDWRREHPDTTVLASDPVWAERYASDPYTSYFGSDALRFPVRPLPSPAAYPLKSPVVAVGGPGAWTAFPFPILASQEGGGASERPAWAPLASALTYRPEGPTVAVDTARLPSGAAVIYASYFTWYATHEADTVWATAAPRAAQPE